MFLIWEIYLLPFILANHLHQIHSSPCLSSADLAILLITRFEMTIIFWPSPISILNQSGFRSCRFYFLRNSSLHPLHTFYQLRVFYIFSGWLHSYPSYSFCFQNLPLLSRYFHLHFCFSWLWASHFQLISLHLPPFDLHMSF